MESGMEYFVYYSMELVYWGLWILLEMRQGAIGDWVTRIGFQHAMHAARHAAAYLQRHLSDTWVSRPAARPRTCLLANKLLHRKCPPADWHVILIFIVSSTKFLWLANRSAAPLLASFFEYPFKEALYINILYYYFQDTKICERKNTRIFNGV